MAAPADAARRRLWRRVFRSVVAGLGRISLSAGLWATSMELTATSAITSLTANLRSRADVSVEVEQPP